MNALEYGILAVFKKEPQREFRTSEIVRAVLLKEYDPIKVALIGDANHEARRDAGKKKGELHRRILYHLNKLVKENILKVARVTEHGEKVFCLALEPGEYMIEKKEKKILISKPEVPILPIDKFMEKKIAKVFEPESYMSRMNAVLVNAERIKDMHELSVLVKKLFSVVNDCIGIINMEVFLQKELGIVKAIVTSLHIDTEEYQKEVSITIDLGKLADTKVLDEFMEFFVGLNPERIHLVFAADQKGLHRHKKVMEKVVANFSSLKRSVNFQNLLVQSAPIIMGSAGVYAFAEGEWQGREDVPVVVCGWMSILVDVHEFMRTLKAADDFTVLIRSAAETMLMANRLQRVHMSPALAEMQSENSVGQNYIRLWNYDLERDPQVLGLLERSKKELDLFCQTEETIYKSCGIPIRFRISLSSKFCELDEGWFSKKVYRKKSVMRLKEFEEEGVLRSIAERERLCKVFGNADRVRFFRGRGERGADILHEAGYVLAQFDLPLFCYDFGERKGEVTLEKFFQ